MSRSQKVRSVSSGSPASARWIITTRYTSTAITETPMPKSENICSGTTEKPVTRSKLRRISL
jgi:hypothetical protein